MTASAPLFASGSVVHELWRYVEQVLQSEADWPTAEARAFLASTNDDTRLRNADLCTQKILGKNDAEDGNYFRRAVQRRELGGEVSFAAQRDHSAHTLYNYMLGRYFHDKIPAIKSEMDTAFKLRGLVPDFAGLWFFVSLLHDVGHMFEGAISALDWAIQSHHVRRAAEVYNDFFSHAFWEACFVKTEVDREHLLDLAKVRAPNVMPDSLAEVARGLARLPDLVRLAGRVNVERNGSPLPTLPQDAFALWQAHYHYFGQASMISRVSYIRESFQHLLLRGLQDSGHRLLDHGVCSGLLQLQWSTFFFQIWFAAAPGQDKRRDQLEKNVHDDRRHRYGTSLVYEADWWWSAVVWATAATAMHNILQMGPRRIYPTWNECCSIDRDTPVCESNCSPLTAKEDPLAYLGILVDCLQDWDRYAVSNEPAIVGQLPAQGGDVGLKFDSNTGRVAIDFNNDVKRVRKIVNDLDTALDGWRAFVDLLP